MLPHTLILPLPLLLRVHSLCCVATGVFAFALIFCTFFFIGKIDKAPRKDCCGCTCHTIGKYEGTVFPDSLPQFNQPFDNPLGPYQAPNGAMWSEGGEVAAHVVLHAPGAAAVKKDY
jgi:hypothetical protein